MIYMLVWNVNIGGELSCRKCSRRKITSGVTDKSEVDSFCMNNGFLNIDLVGVFVTLTA